MDVRYLEIGTLGADMHEGETRAGQLCPFCSGGSSGERTLSLKRDNHRILYMCHRASCGAKGSYSARSQAAKEYRRKERRFVTVTDPLTDELASELMSKYHLTSEEIRRGEISTTTAYSSDGHLRVYLPKHRMDGTVRGYTARALDKVQTPKALSFVFHEDEPNLGWYFRGRSRPLVIVEDAFSALRVSSFCNAVYLSGTHISDAIADELVRSGITPVYLMLDRDATRQAVKLALRYSNKCKMHVVPLPMDLKNMARPVLEEFLTEHTEVIDGVGSPKERSGRPQAFFNSS